MPNWCMNDLTIKADSKEELQDVLSKIRSEESALCFERICPTPPELKDTTSPSNKGSLDCSLTRLNGIFTGEVKDYRDWHEFRLGEWGTKWNVEVDEDRVVEISDTEVAMGFDSAWSPPAQIIDKLISKFPKASFCLDYFEPGCCFAGTYADGIDVNFSDEDEGYRSFAEEKFGWDFSYEEEDN